MAVGLNNSLTFGGINSANYGIFIDGGGVFNSPQRDVSMISIPGRNGDLIIDNGRFENVEVTYSAFIDGRPDGTIHDRVQAFRNAIGALRGYQRLEDTYNTDEYRQAVYIGGLEVDPVIYQTGGEIELTFNCKPQRWLKSGEEAITLEPGRDDSGGQLLGVEISNPTEFNAAPLFKVYGGYGAISIYCDNGGVWPTYAVTIANGAVNVPPLYVDCEILEAYEYENGIGTNIVSRNEYVSMGGSDPSGRVYLMPDSQYTNWVYVSPTITQIEMIPRWWRV